MSHNHSLKRSSFLSPLLRLGIVLTLLIAGLASSMPPAAGASATPKGPAATTRQVGGETLIVEPAGVVSWQEMLAYEAAHASGATPASPGVVPYMTPPEPRELTGTPTHPAPEAPPSAPASPQGAGTLVDDFEALGDDNTRIPPDTMGAAGPNHLMVMLNTQVRIQSKTGTNLSTVSLSTFWTSGTGLSGSPFDPRLIYDSLSGRWMAIVDADAKSGTSAVWFAISATSSPTSTWTFYGWDVDAADTYWADFPDIGTNSTWIAITNNMYTISTPYTFSGAQMWVIDKSTALAGGALTTTIFARGFDVAGGYGGFTLRPALTFDTAEGTLYIVDGNSYSSGGVGLLRLSRITGTGPSPIWSVLPGTSTPWPNTGWFFTNLTYHLTQIDADQLGTATDVETNDPRLLNAVFRNGHLWTTHSGGYPRATPADRTIVAWYELTPSLPNPIVQSGAIDGGAGVHHFFPSITVNAANDMTIGFSRSDATRYVEGIFTGRRSADTAGTVGAITVCKLGEDSYIKDFGTGLVRWGDYSATVVDPVDDLSFWTIQEYAETDVGSGSSDDRWGTWWCHVSIYHIYLPLVLRNS